MSNKEENRELLIPFESFLNRGIHKEKPESFQNSFFKDVYSQATEAIVIIDESNKKRNNDNSEQKLYDVQNVIAFTGRRGTGKTSAMLTFADYLTSRTNIDFSKYSLKNKKFYSIPYIDASMLEKNEDIFEVILSKMLIELKNGSNQSHYHDLSQHDAYFNDTREKIVSVYNQYVSLKKASEFDSESSCSLMEKLAEKHDIRGGIVELIPKYIRCMAMCDSSQYVSKNDNGYLVYCPVDIQ